MDYTIYKYEMIDIIIKQGTNVAHNVRGGLLIDLTIVAIALLLRYTLSMSLKLTDIYHTMECRCSSFRTVLILEQLTKWYLSEY